VHGGYANYRKALLKTGVALYEMRPQALDGGSSLFGSSGASLHTKAFVVDDRYGFIGSFNIDPRSIMLNTEMGVLFDEPALAIALREEYQRLSGPDRSYWVYLDGEDRLRWLDRAADPPVVLEHEPETSWWQRALARVVGWLPVESQL
jgi:putative cardiolipin synthase